MRFSWRYFPILLYGFLMFFFLWYIGEFGITNLVLEPITKWQVVFNIGLWLIIVMYFIDKFFEEIRLVQKEFAKQSKEVKKK